MKPHKCNTNRREVRTEVVKGKSKIVVIKKCSVCGAPEKK